MSDENNTDKVVSDIRERVSKATTIAEGIAQLLAGVFHALNTASSDEQKQAVEKKLDEESNVFANAITENVDQPKV